AAGRTRRDTEGLIGFLVNTLALRGDLSGNPTFRELLGRVRAANLDALTHQDLPLDKVVEILQPPRETNRTPVFQVLFQLLSMPLKPAGFEGLSVGRFEFDTKISKFDLSVELLDRPEGLLCRTEYNTDLYRPETIQRLAAHFETLLKAIADD